MTLHLLQTRDVAQYAGVQAKVIDLTDCQVCREQRTIFSSTNDFPSHTADVWFIACQKPFDETFLLTAEGRGHQHAQILSDQFVLRIAKDLFRGLIDAVDQPVVIKRNYRVRRCLQDGPNAFFALPEGIERMALHGYVSDQSQQQRGLARSIGKNRDELANVYGSTVLMCVTIFDFVGTNFA